MASDGKFKFNGGDQNITSTELEYVLEVNRKSIELSLQNISLHEIALKEIENLGDNIDSKISKKMDTIEKKIDEMEKSLFRLQVFLGILGAGVLFQIAKILFSK